MSYITRLIRGPETDIELNEEDLAPTTISPPMMPPAVPLENRLQENVGHVLGQLEDRKAKLEDQIADLTDQLRQVDLGLEAYTEARKIFERNAQKPAQLSA